MMNTIHVIWNSPGRNLVADSVVEGRERAHAWCQDCYLLDVPNGKENEIRHCSRQFTIGTSLDWKWLVYWEREKSCQKGCCRTKRKGRPNTSDSRTHFFSRLNDLCQSFHTKTTALFTPFLYKVASVLHDTLGGGLSPLKTRCKWSKMHKNRVNCLISAAAISFCG